MAFFILQLQNDSERWCRLLLKFSATENLSKSFVRRALNGRNAFS